VNGAKMQLRIRLDLEALEEGRQDELSSLLAAHSGDTPVVFELVRPGDFLVRIQSRAPRGVKAGDELLDRLRALCGGDAIRLEKQVAGM